jgi:hypothetical protein
MGAERPAQPARSSGLLGTMFSHPFGGLVENEVIECPQSLKVGFKCLADRPAENIRVLPVCADKPLNPVRVPNIDLGSSVEPGVIAKVEHGLETLARRDIAVRDATNVMAEERPNRLLPRRQIDSKLAQGVLKQRPGLLHDEATSGGQLADCRQIHALGEKSIGDSRKFFTRQVT